jgi:hypothetical protein
MPGEAAFLDLRATDWSSFGYRARNCLIVLKIQQEARLDAAKRVEYGAAPAGIPKHP